MYKEKTEYVRGRAVLETSGKAKAKQRFLEKSSLAPWGSVLKPIFICPLQGCESVQRPQGQIK